VILHRCFAWDREAAPEARGGALWFARMLQGHGRHDNPLVYGCLYVSESPLSALVEQLARFTGRELRPDMLRRHGLALGLAALALPDGTEVVDLDDPRTLAAEDLRPSLVATHERARTQSDAAALFERHPEAAGLRWWSTFEAQWANVTLFDRAGPALGVEDARALDVDDEVVVEAAVFLGLR
jgi:hypothetical protein